MAHSDQQKDGRTLQTQVRGSSSFTRNFRSCYKLSELKKNLLQKELEKSQATVLRPASSLTTTQLLAKMAMKSWEGVTLRKMYL